MSEKGIVFRDTITNAIQKDCLKQKCDYIKFFFTLQKSNKFLQNNISLIINKLKESLELIANESLNQLTTTATMPKLLDISEVEQQHQIYKALLQQITVPKPTQQIQKLTSELNTAISEIQYIEQFTIQDEPPQSFDSQQEEQIWYMLHRVPKEVPLHLSSATYLEPTPSDLSKLGDVVHDRIQEVKDIYTNASQQHKEYERIQKSLFDNYTGEKNRVLFLEDILEDLKIKYLNSWNKVQQIYPQLCTLTQQQKQLEHPQTVTTNTQISLPPTVQQVMDNITPNPRDIVSKKIDSATHTNLQNADNVPNISPL